MLEIVVFEPQPYWGPLLKHWVLDPDACPWPCQVRSAGHLRDLPRTGPAVNVIDLTRREADVWSWVAQWAPTVTTIVVGNEQHQELEWVLREAGVLQFVGPATSPREFLQLIRRVVHSLSTPRAPLRVDR